MDRIAIMKIIILLTGISYIVCLSGIMYSAFKGIRRINKIEYGKNNNNRDKRREKN
jgi:hypothetical protein